MDSEERPVVTEASQDRVRAGVAGHNVRLVLVASVALVVVLFVLVDLVMRRRRAAYSFPTLLSM